MLQQDKQVGVILRKLARDHKMRQLFVNDKNIYQLLLKSAKRYIVGENRDEAVQKMSTLVAHGYQVSVEYMGGEDTLAPAICNQNKAELISIIKTLALRDVKANICFDLSTIGLAINQDLTFNNVFEIAEQAQQYGQSVIISMEEFTKYSLILEIYFKLAQRCSNIGITVQVYLPETNEALLQKIIETKGIVRLSKGAYHEQHALERSSTLNDRYMKFLKLLCEHSASPIHAATHDDAIFNKIMEEGDYYKNKIILEMLHGVRPDKAKQFKQLGYQTCIYGTYGQEWLLYFLHRIAEYPANLTQAFIDYFYPDEISNNYI